MTSTQLLPGYQSAILVLFRDATQSGCGLGQAEMGPFYCPRDQLSVRMELQADCFAGVRGHDAGQRGLLEPGDVEEGLRAAAAIGDDRIQQLSGRGVHPESFTHGSSAQRVEWLRRGLESGDPEACNTL